MRTANFAFNNGRQELSEDMMRMVAPSIFAQEPWGGVSENYRFIPTIEVVRSAQKEGFVPVKVNQSRSRIEGKGDFTKHIIRLRRREHITGEIKVGQEVPEICLTNAHDRSSAYILNMGIWRYVCGNGMQVQSAHLSEIRVRHSGRQDIVGEVIEGSFKIIEDAPRVLEQIGHWKGMELSTKEQEALAVAAIELRGTNLEVRADEVLAARRHEDSTTGNGSRSLWRTMNTVQEHIVKGGVRGIKSVDADTKFNRALWLLTEKMAELKA